MGIKNMLVKFNIQGNHDNLGGNPLPRLKKTGNQRWTSSVKRYADWKNYVRQCFFETNNHQQIKIGDCDHRFDQLGDRWNKPIDVNCKSHMAIKIFWASKEHCEPENIFSSIADALFVNDKNLDGSFESLLASDRRGRVEVTINIDD